MVAVPSSDFPGAPQYEAAGEPGHSNGIQRADIVAFGIKVLLPYKGMKIYHFLQDSSGQHLLRKVTIFLR